MASAALVLLPAASSRGEARDDGDEQEQNYDASECRDEIIFPLLLIAIESVMQVCLRLKFVVHLSILSSFFSKLCIFSVLEVLIFSFFFR